MNPGLFNTKQNTLAPFLQLLKRLAINSCVPFFSSFSCFSDQSLASPTCLGVIHAVIHLNVRFLLVTCYSREKLLVLVAFLLCIVYLYEAIQYLLLSTKSFIILPSTSKLGKIRIYFYTKGRMRILFNFMWMKTDVYKYHY